MTLSGDWAALPSDSIPSDSGDIENFYPELLDSTDQQPPFNKSDVPYEELWLDNLRGYFPKPSLSEGIRSINNGCSTTAPPSYTVTCPLGAVTSSDVSLTPPPVPPKSEAVIIILYITSCDPDDISLA